VSDHDPPARQAPPCVGCGGVHGGTQATINCLELYVRTERERALAYRGLLDDLRMAINRMPIPP
jgi:hypothetical protein